MLINVGSYDSKFLENKIEKINASNEIHKHICHLSAALCTKNKIHKKKKNMTFLIISPSKLEHWLKFDLKQWIESTINSQNIHFGKQ